MPVAAVPGVAHLVPSVAPLAHTNETKASCGMSAFAVAIGGKADMSLCAAYVRL
jgi:hypothetical protein